MNKETQPDMLAEDIYGNMVEWFSKETVDTHFIAKKDLEEVLKKLDWPIAERDEGLALQEKIGHNGALQDLRDKLL